MKALEELTGSSSVVWPTPCVPDQPHFREWLISYVLTLVLWLHVEDCVLYRSIYTHRSQEDYNSHSGQKQYWLLPCVPCVTLLFEKKIKKDLTLLAGTASTQQQWDRKHIMDQTWPSATEASTHIHTISITTPLRSWQSAATTPQQRHKYSQQ